MDNGIASIWPIRMYCKHLIAAESARWYTFSMTKKRTNTTTPALVTTEQIIRGGTGLSTTPTSVTLPLGAIYLDANLADHSRAD